MDYKHRPVLLSECIEALAIKPEGVYVDGTLGRAGHAIEIAAKLSKGLLIGKDRDEKAIEEAGEKLSPYIEKVKLIHGNFRDIESIIRELGLSGVDGILLDLGVSSHQLDDRPGGG
jgi:16S rRNA (cytosine1402-N4)-methyltransferase